MTNTPRSAGALLAGFAIVIALSLGTDTGLHAAGLFPALGDRMSDSQLLLATAYRTLYGVLGAYTTARLAPNRPMQHALLSGAIGLAIAALGAAATWNRDLGPHWYSLALAALALPQSWLGGKLRLMQQERRL